MNVHDTTPTVTKPHEAGDLGRHFIYAAPTQEGEAPELFVSDGDASVTLGSPEEAHRLADAIRSAHATYGGAGAQEPHREALAALARQTTCEIPGCDRQLHTEHPAAEWSHRFSSREHLGMLVELIQSSDGTNRAHVYAHLDAAHDAEQLRTLATRLQLQAAQLLEEADVLESRDRTVQLRTDVDAQLLDLEG